MNKQIKEQENITKSLGGNLEREIDLMEAQGVGVDARGLGVGDVAHPLHPGGGVAGHGVHDLGQEPLVELRNDAGDLLLTRHGLIRF